MVQRNPYKAEQEQEEPTESRDLLLTRRAYIIIDVYVSYVRSAKEVAEWNDISYRTASRLLKQLTESGYLYCIDTYTRPHVYRCTEAGNIIAQNLYHHLSGDRPMRGQYLFTRVGQILAQFPKFGTITRKDLHLRKYGTDHQLLSTLEKSGYIELKSYYEGFRLTDVGHEFNDAINKIEVQGIDLSKEYRKNDIL